MKIKFIIIIFISIVCFKNVHAISYGVEPGDWGPKRLEGSVRNPFNQQKSLNEGAEPIKPEQAPVTTSPTEVIREHLKDTLIGVNLGSSREKRSILLRYDTVFVGQPLYKGYDARSRAKRFHNFETSFWDLTEEGIVFIVMTDDQSDPVPLTISWSLLDDELGLNIHDLK